MRDCMFQRRIYRLQSKLSYYTVEQKLFEPHYIVKLQSHFTLTGAHRKQCWHFVVLDILNPEKNL